MNTYELVALSANATILHPLVALLLLILIPVSLAKGRRAAMAGLLVVLNFVTAAQRLYVGGVNLPIYRLLIFILILRMILRREYAAIRLGKLDSAVIVQVLFTALAGFLRNPAFSAVTYQVSLVVDTLGGYLVVRSLVRDAQDVRNAISAIMWIALPIALIFIVERVTGRNPMAPFGGVLEHTWIREGKRRVQGPYPHVILAGAYWAACVPLFWAIEAKTSERRFLKYAATGGALVVIVLCASSTPLMSLMVGLFVIVLFYQQNVIGRVKAFAVAAVVGLSIAWSKPIWFLLARIDFTGGSTGYYRYLLIDGFIRNWNQWIVIGARSSTELGAGLVDVCNEYVLKGLDGGLIGFGTFVAAIAFAFAYLGKLLKVAVDKSERRLYWGLSASLIVHMMNYLGVSYFSQMVLAWWTTLAFFASLHQSRCLSPTGAADRLGEPLGGGAMGAPGLLPSR